MDIFPKSTELWMGVEIDHMVQFFHLITRLVCFLLISRRSHRIMRNKFSLADHLRKSLEYNI